MDSPALARSTLCNVLRFFLPSRNCEQAFDAEIVHTSGRASTHTSHTRSSIIGLAVHAVHGRSVGYSSNGTPDHQGPGGWGPGGEGALTQTHFRTEPGKAKIGL